jgi:hypothetical protein
MDDYLERLAATREQYPFARWAESEMDQYTEEACASFAAVFDELIRKLGALGERASEEKKIEAFREAVEALD